MLKISTSLAIAVMACLMTNSIDQAPAILYWLMQWTAMAVTFITYGLAFELFKTFSAVGGYFTIQAVTRALYMLIGWYVLCIGGQYVILGNIGTPTNDLIFLVQLANAVV